MALEPHGDPLDRARLAARQEQPEGWIEVSASVMARVRAHVTPSEPLLAFAESGASDRDGVGSRTFVSERVVSAAIRRVLQRPTHAPEDIDLLVVDGRLTHVTLALVCAYGVDLVALADLVRSQVHAEVVGILGPDPEFGPGSVSIDVVDVVLGDPNLV